MNLQRYLKRKNDIILKMQVIHKIRDGKRSVKAHILSYTGSKRGFSSIK
jgi:hypothetical protein